MFKFLLILLAAVVLIITVLILFVILKPYFLVVDTICLFTGGNGSGKTFFSVHQAIVQLKKNRFKVFLLNINPYRRLILKRPKIKKPILISSIPVRVSLFEMSTPLDFNPFVLQERLPEKCVVFIDEINLFLSQMDYKIESEDLIGEFVTLFRHQTKGGHLILNTQNVNKVHWIFRYCANRSYNLCEFRKPILGLPVLAWAKCRHVSVGDDIKTVENQDVDEGRHNLFAFFPCFGLSIGRRYDTYCYSERYTTLPLFNRNKYTKLKRNSVMHIDKAAKFPVLINDDDEFTSGGAGSELVTRPTEYNTVISWKNRKNCPAP